MKPFIKVAIRWSRPAMVAAVGVAVIYSAVMVVVNIKRANAVRADTSASSMAGVEVSGLQNKPAKIERLLAGPDRKGCGFGQIRNVKTASCVWATRSNKNDISNELSDEAVNEKLHQVIKLLEAGKEKEAKRVLEPPLLAGHPHAQLLAAAFFYNGDLLEKNRSKAMELVRLSADQNEAKAQYQLGEWLIEDCSDACPNIKEALRMLKAASKAGLHEATEQIGRIYFLGIGVPQDRDIALPYIKSAAEGGMPTSQRVLGTIFYRGVVIPRSYELSMKWLKKAAHQGDANAMAKVAGLYNLGLGTEKDTQKGVMWSWLGARNGDAGAQYLLATLILEGIAGIDERSIGLTWLKVSASAGYADAKEALKRIRGKLDSEEETRAEVEAKKCLKNLKQCGKPPWKWKGFGGAKIEMNQI